MCTGVIRLSSYWYRYYLSFLFSLLLCFSSILDLSWVQRRSSPSAYYQSTSSLTFRKEGNKKGAAEWRGKKRGDSNSELWRQVWPFLQIPSCNKSYNYSWLFIVHDVVRAPPLAQKQFFLIYFLYIQNIFFKTRFLVDWIFEVGKVFLIYEIFSTQMLCQHMNMDLNNFNKIMENWRKTLSQKGKCFFLDWNVQKKNMNEKAFLDHRQLWLSG